MYMTDAYLPANLAKGVHICRSSRSWLGSSNQLRLEHLWRHISWSSVSTVTAVVHVLSMVIQNLQTQGLAFISGSTSSKVRQPNVSRIIYKDIGLRKACQ